MANNKMIIGRDDACDICIDSPYLSSRHAEIALVDATTLTFTIKDLDSTNGTFINDEQVTHRPFGFSDKVALGAYVLEARDFIPFFVNLQERDSQVAVSRQQDGKSYVAVGISLIAMLSLTVVAVAWPQALLATLAVYILAVCTYQLTQGIIAQHRRKEAEKQYFEFKQKALTEQIKEQQERYSQEQKELQHQWQGYRKFRVVKKAAESAMITSFYLQAHDGEPIPAFKPGQYLTFRLNVPGLANPVIRCYSLSAASGENYYRVSIKREVSYEPNIPHGLASNYFHDHIHEGDILDVKNPSGHFYLDTTQKAGIVMLAGGVGITPMLSMIETMLKEDKNNTPMWLFYGASETKDFIQLPHLRELAEKYDNLNVCCCASRPEANAVYSLDYDHAGRVNLDVLKEKLGSSNYRFYLCGPGAFMQSLYDDLMDWGVPEDDVHAEAFGPASIKKKSVENVSAQLVEVEFRKSGKIIQAPSTESILEIADKNAVFMESGCRAGSCGSCETAIIDGEVRYEADLDYEPRGGSCLSCMAKPSGTKVVIDA